MSCRFGYHHKTRYNAVHQATPCSSCQIPASSSFALFLAVNEFAYVLRAFIARVDIQGKAAGIEGLLQFPEDFRQHFEVSNVGVVKHLFYDLRSNGVKLVNVSVYLLCQNRPESISNALVISPGFA